MKRNINSSEFAGIDSAAAAVKAGDSIWFNGDTSAAAEFARALSSRTELKNVTIVSVSAMEPETIRILEGSKNIRLISGIGDAIAQIYENNKLEVLKATASGIVNILCRDFKINTVITQVSYPDAGGRCTLPSICRAVTSGISAQDCIEKHIAILSDSICSDPTLPENAGMSLDSFELVCELGCAKQVSIA